MKLVIIFIITSVSTASKEPTDDTRICEHYCATGFLRDDYYEKVGYRSFFDYLRKDEHECVKTTDLGRDGVFSFIRNEPPASVAGYIEDTDPEEVGLECVKADVKDSGDVEPREDSCTGVLGYLQGVKPEGVGYEGAVDFLRGYKPEDLGYEGAVIYFRGLDQEGGAIKDVKQKYVENEDIYLETVNFHHCDDSEDNVQNQCKVPDIEIDEAVLLNPQNDNDFIVYNQETQDISKIPCIDFDITTKSFEPEKEENIYFECIKPDDVEGHVIKLPCHEENKGFNDKCDDNYGFVEIEVYPKNKTRGVSITLPADNFDDSCSHSEYLHKLVSKYFPNNNNFNVIPKILDFNSCYEDYDPNCDDYSKAYDPKNVNIGYPIIDILTYNDLNNQSHPDNYNDSFQRDDPKAYSFTPIEHKIEDFDIKPVDFSKDLHKKFEPINIYYGDNEFVLYLKENENVFSNRDKPVIVDFDVISNADHGSERLPNDDPTLSSHSFVEPDKSSEKMQNDDNSLSEQNLHNNKEDPNIDTQDEKQQNTFSEHQTDFNNINAHTSENKDEDANLQGDDPNVIELENNRTKSPETTQLDYHDIIVILFIFLQNDNHRASRQQYVSDKNSLTNGGGPKHIDSKDFIKQDDNFTASNDSVVNRSKDVNNCCYNRGLNVFFKKRIFLIFIFSRSRQLIKR